MTVEEQLAFVIVGAVVAFVASAVWAWHDLFRDNGERDSYPSVFRELKRRETGRLRRVARWLNWS